MRIFNALIVKFIILTMLTSCDDGKIFDETKEEFRYLPVEGVVPGVAEGLKLLGKGGNAIIYIPSKLGYGELGHQIIGIRPNQTLIFEVEILDISKDMPKDFIK